MLVKIKNAVGRFRAAWALKRNPIEIKKVFVKQGGEWKEFVPAQVVKQKEDKQDEPVVGLPDPKDYLGENYGDPVVWKHADDLFVDFQVIEEVIADDVSFFMRYLNYELSKEDRDVYPYFYTQCFAEVKEVVLRSMQTPLLEISEEQSCFIVFFQNVMGLLLFSNTNADDVRKRAFGSEEVPEKMFYQMTFMCFDQKVIERIGFTHTPNEIYLDSKKRFDPLRVNFAIYNENE